MVICKLLKIKKIGPQKSAEIPMETYGQNGELLINENIVIETWKNDFEKLYNNDENNTFNDDFHMGALSHKLLLEDRMLDPLYDSNMERNRKAMNRNWRNQKANPALKTKTGNK